MSTNENKADIEPKSEGKGVIKDDLSEGEIATVPEEPQIYKKVKLNSEQPHKKRHDHDHEDRGRGYEEKSEHKHKHKEKSSSSKDHRSDKHEHKESKHKSEKSSEHKKYHKEHSKDDGERKHKDKSASEHKKSSKEDGSKKKSHSDKERHRDSSPKDKEKREKKNKNKEKKERKEDSKQQKLDSMMGDNKEKKNKSKSKDDSERKFLDFAKKYPQYVSKGRFKFPIEDRLFTLYGSLLSEHVPKHKKPTPKKGFIPPNNLGDILQIWNFFNSFSDMFKFEDIQREEIYAGLKYNGEESLMLINDMHQGLLAIFAQEFIKKHRFETQKDEIENAFFILIKHIIGDSTPDGDELALIWTEFAQKLVHLVWFRDIVTETGKRNFKTLAEKTVLGYNKLDFKTKTKLLIDLIECVHETEVFHDFLQAKMEEITTLQRQKNELLNEIKADEAEYYEIKFKIETADKKSKEDLKSMMGKQERKPKDEAERKEQIKNMNRLEVALADKQARIDEINADIGISTQTAQLIGLDSNKSEYWVFLHEPIKIYVRYPAIMNDNEAEDQWFFYDKQEDVDHLLKSLNPKGVREKNLYDNLKTMLSNGTIHFPKEEKEKLLDEKEEVKEDKMAEETNFGDKEEEKKDDKKASSTVIKKEVRKDEKPVQDFNHWFAKVMEYEAFSAEENIEGRTTRRKYQATQSKQEQRMKQKDAKNLQLENIKQMMLNTEHGMTGYLEKWNARWTKPKNKEKIIKAILDAKTPEELAQMLLRLNDSFQYSETVVSRRRHTAGAVEEPQDEEEPQQDIEDDEAREEEELAQEEQEKADRQDEEYFYDEDSPVIRKKEKKLMIDDDEENDAEKNERSRSNEEEEEENDNDNDIKEEKQEERESSPSEKRRVKEEEIAEKKEEPKPETEIMEEDDDEEEGVRIKKIPLRIWGLSNEKIKRCWINLVKQVNSIGSLFFVAHFFCDIVDKYVTKKTSHYFSNFKNAKEWYAAKRQAKQQATQAKQAEQKFVAKINADKLESYKMKRKENRERREQRAIFASIPSKTEGVSSRLRERGNREPLIDDFDYNPREERMRTKAERLEELASIRRSERLKPISGKKYENLNEEQWDNECKKCGEAGEPEDIVSCGMCQHSYHLECIGLKTLPEGEWTCVDCLQRIAAQRQTRSSSRRLQNQQILLLT